MKGCIHVIFLFCSLLISGTLAAERRGNSLMYILDMVHNNPGEANVQTKYTNPAVLKDLGFNGMVPQWHVQCALTYDSFAKGIIPEGSKDREWIIQQQKEIKKKLKAAKTNGLKVYPFTDMLVLPTIMLEKYADEIVREKDIASGFSAIHGKLVPDINRSLTCQLIRAQIKELFETFPELDGLTIRFGETYLFDTPYHAGGNPVSSGGNEGVQGHVKLIKLLREEVCEKYNKKLFYRTWDFGFFHTDADIYLKITDQVEPHPNLMFSIKYCRGDFHRLMQFNPTLGIGRHNYIVEYQGQPEYYGKGAHPVYVFGGMLNGFSEYKQNMRSGVIQSVSELKNDSKFKGLWTWSRGGGWRGPYITNELWCDVNTYTAAVWAQDTTLTEVEALKRSLPKIGVELESIDLFINLLHMAEEAVLKGQCTAIDINNSNFNVWWTRDQYFSGEQELSRFIDYIIKNDREDEILAEKREAVVLWKKIEEVAGKIKMKNDEDEIYLRTSATYGRIKHEIIANIFTIFLYGRKSESEALNKNVMRKAIGCYDMLWKEWKNLKESHLDCATLYEPNAFSLTDFSGVKGDSKNGVGATVDKYRKMCEK